MLFHALWGIIMLIHFTFPYDADMQSGFQVAEAAYVFSEKL